MTSTRMTSALDRQLRHVATALRDGGIAVYPTDTAYGIGCRYDHPAAIKRVMAIKGRSDSRFTIIASSQSQVEKYFQLNTNQRRLASAHWPGPLSIVVSKKFAVRVPKNQIARNLARRVGAPLIATSVNTSGQPAAYSITDQVVSWLSGQQSEVHIINVGPLAQTAPSTVVECTNDDIIVHRSGEIDPKHL